ncbi:BrnT family toxin [Polymorphobacter fuscus]|uniref:BrnT family toxin n=1 Tax=Sandarakinorhabdus fusca TaxID=1439888 RepID=A0A7C9GN61_9SPHN|nr:BrnT family toxin [Polymorphobacter fuscus]KAB7648453.1 BrnT family toxin [Polymorphobacter fuscus]MQT15976.1 BrnT family toxin [Polymorphobacter fuscus]NJC07747.1 hypothetical protein [Polymorphobacter fuscus]
MFEFDPAKSILNADKHGIDFDEAQALWRDERRSVVSSNDKASEVRQLVVGRIGDRIWTAIVTQRGDVVRIISVRRARDREIEVYERED